MSDNLRIETSTNVYVDYQLAGLGPRIAASLLDTLLRVIYLLTWFLVLGTWDIRDGDVATVAYYMGLFLPIALYSLLFEWLAEGRTPGKMILKIRVVRLDGRECGFAGYFLRWLFRLVDIVISSGSVAIISIVSTRHQQRLGDLVAGTTVVSYRRNKFEDRSVWEVQTEYVPVFENAGLMSNGEVEILEDLEMQLKSHPGPAVYELLFHARTRLTRKYGFESNLNDMDFLRTILHDYRQQAMQ